MSIIDCVIRQMPLSVRAETIGIQLRIFTNDQTCRDLHVAINDHILELGLAVDFHMGQSHDTAKL